MSNKYGPSSKKETTAQQARSASKRLDMLENALARSLVGVERRFGQQNNLLTQLQKILQAVVELVGADEVQAVVDRLAQEEAEAITQQGIKLLEKGLEGGYVTPAEVIDETSLLVGYEVDAAGEPVGTGRQQIPFTDISPDIQAELKGKGVGAVVKTPTGGTFEVKEVYSVDNEKARAVLTAAAQAAAQSDEQKEESSEESSDE